ncbi:hypothetical protein OAH73_05590 [Planktomarina sp.]|nr:hypothetical protein [Planktomarina sp.]MDB4842023.1 hypothetical protein [Planktomarina sp.]
MLKHLLISLAFLMTLSSPVSAEDVGDGSSSNGGLKFICDGITLIITSTEEGWALMSKPDVEIYTTYDGFMLIDHQTGISRSLGKSSGADVMYVYYENGTEKYDCVVTREK